MQVWPMVVILAACVGMGLCAEREWRVRSDKTRAAVLAVCLSLGWLQAVCIFCERFFWKG